MTATHSTKEKTRAERTSTAATAVGAVPKLLSLFVSTWVWMLPLPVVLRVGLISVLIIPMVWVLGMLLGVCNLIINSF